MPGGVPTRQRRLEALDVIRGAAILLVMLRHSWPSAFPGAGIVGVIIFFALSGYLITGVLIRDTEKFGRVRYGRFYAHRAFRLLPALIAFLCCYALIESAANVLGDRAAGRILPTIVVALLYIRDFPLPLDVSQTIDPLWTLAVEEQFYLLWPVLLVAALRRKRQFILVVAAGASIYICMLLSVVLTTTIAQDKFIYVYSLPSTWATGLVVGGAAQLFRARILATIKQAPTQRLIAWIGSGILVALCFYPHAKDSPFFYVIAGPVIAIIAAGLVIVASNKESLTPAALPLRALGIISYAAYLWNYPLLLWLSGGRPQDPSPSTSLIVFLLTPVTAIVSWFTVEQLGRYLRKRFDAWDRGRVVRGGS